jgi:hypothetical protein
MKYALSIGVGQNLLETYDFSFKKIFEEKVKRLGLSTRECDIDGNIVEVVWWFEGTLTDHDYIPSRVDMLLGLLKDERRINCFSIRTRDCDLGSEKSGLLTYDYNVCGETILIQPLRHFVGMFLHERHKTNTHSLEEIAKGFQKMCEWFTVQTSAYKAMEQGHTALTKHHRFADAAAKFLEAQEMILRNLEFPPITS